MAGILNNVAMILNVRQNGNSKSEYFGHWYPYVRNINTITTRALCDHIAQHGGLVTREVVEIVLNRLSVCIPELVSMGVGVKLNGIGIFYPTAKSVKTGMANKQAVRDTNPKDAVSGINFRFKADNTELDKLTSKAFKGKCSVQWGDFDTITKVTRGEGADAHTVNLHTYEPITEPDKPSGGGGNG